MPKATTSVDDTQRFDLKTCPEGYVVLRRLTYGQFLKRREMVASMRFEGKSQDDMAGVMQMANRKVTEFEFANCIVDHNLEDDNGVNLDFSKSRTLDVLDPRIGDEISTRIDEMNQFEQSLPNSFNGSVPVS